MGNIPLDPQPLKGKPFRIAFANRGNEWWYNEHVKWPKGNHQLFSWKCPFGVNGYVAYEQGLWVWKEGGQRCAA